MSKKKILIVEDNHINSMLLSKALDLHGYDNQVAISAVYAFELLSDKSFSLILMDIEMPEVDGFEAAKFIRRLNSPYFKEIPIIALTAHKQEDIWNKAMEAKMNDVISKPVDTDELMKKIEDFLRGFKR